jgi:hypothetical protein
MSKITSILACGALLLASSLEVQAFPGSAVRFPVASPDVVPVRGFCGLGRHRGPYGGCVLNGVPYGYAVAPVIVAPPMMVAPRAVCPYGYYYYPPYGRCVPAQ